MTRRRLLLCALPGMVVAVIASAWLLWPSNGITLANAAKIQKGMTLAEVNAILGGPGRHQRTIPALYDRFYSLPPRCRWLNDVVVVGVWLDREGRVEVCLVQAEAPHPQPGLLARFRRLLGL